MRRPMLVRTTLAATFVILATLAWLLYSEVGRTFSEDPTVWEPEVLAFEEEDRNAPPPRDAILFVGSSSIRFWDGLAEDMAPLRVVRRGFGGARLSDLVHYSDRLIFPYAPRAIVIHAGGNELNDLPGNHRLTPIEALGDFRVLVATIRARLPDVPIYYLALRPSRLPGARDAFLALVRADCEAQSGLHYLDAGAGLALEDGTPDPRLIRWDRIHLNRQGYERWAPPVRARLLRDLGGNAREDPPEIDPAQARAMHERLWVLDAHADIEIPGKRSPYVGDDGRSQVEPTKLHAGGVDAVVMAVAVGPGPRTDEGAAAARARADEEIAAVNALVADAANRLVLARSADDLVAAHASGHAALLLGFQNARILGSDIDGLDAFYAAGVRVFALTHMGHNDFADSSRPVFDGALGRHEPEAEHHGLSDLGVAAIARINALGGVIDVSQLSREATLQVVERSTTPVIASHSNVRRLTDVSRNLSDEEIDRIAAAGGVIHVAPFRGYLYDSSDRVLDERIRAARRAAGVTEDFLYPFELYWEIDDPAARADFVAAISELLGPGSVASMLDHLDYIVDRVGVEHVGIGTDFNHGGGVAGFNDASEALNVTLGLLERGYREDEIEKIWGGNFLRVLRAVERAREVRDGGRRRGA